MANAGTNVGFKIGSASRLKSLSSYVEGTFYLTNDTNKLYFAQASNKLVDLNQYIHLWTGANLPTTTDLPNLEVGDIYYWQSRNALLICSALTGGTPSWTQLNPDTYLLANDTTTVQVSAVTDGGRITTSVADTDGLTVKHQATGSFDLIGGDNVTLGISGNQITINASQPTVNGYKFTTTTSGTTGLINLYNTTTNGVVTEGTITFKTPSSNNIATISSDNARNITITVPPRPVTSLAHSFDANGVLSTAVGTADNGSNLAVGTVTPIVSYGKGATKSTAKFESGTASLDIYTASEIDDLLEQELGDFDAMHYKGTVTSSDIASKLGQASSTSGKFKGQVGDTYKVASAITATQGGSIISNFPADGVRIGDLLIAEGTDDAVSWVLVPSGNDQAINGSVSGNSMVISDGTNTVAGIALAESTDATRAKITLTSSISNKINTITVAHGDAGTGTAQTYTSVAQGTTLSAGSNPTGNYIDIPTITGISKDAAGHITSLTTGTYRVVDTHASLTNVRFDLSDTTPACTDSRDTDNSVEISVGVVNSDSSSAAGSYIMSTTTNSSVKFRRIEAEGATPIVMIDLVWGSF